MLRYRKEEFLEGNKKATPSLAEFSKTLIKHVCSKSNLYNDMGVNTICHILKYDDNKNFKEVFTINPVRLRMDDGIYNSILNWEIIVDAERTEEICEEYKLTKDEVKKLLFKNYWCEDILEPINEGEEDEDSVDNFEKVEKINLLKKREIQLLLEKIYQVCIQKNKTNETINLDKWDLVFLQNLGMIIGALSVLDDDGYVQIIFYQY